MTCGTRSQTTMSGRPGRRGSILPSHAMRAIAPEPSSRSGRTSQSAGTEPAQAPEQEQALRRAEAARGDVQPLLAEPGLGHGVGLSHPAQDLALAHRATLEHHLRVLVFGAGHEVGRALHPHSRRAQVHEEQGGLAGSGQGVCDLPEPRGGRARADLPRPRARLRVLPLRPVEAALHPACRAAAVPGGCADRRRDPRGRQRCGRAAVDPRRHARAPRPPGARLRCRPLQRLQHVYYQAASGTSGGSSGRR